MRPVPVISLPSSRRSSPNAWRTRSYPTSGDRAKTPMISSPVFGSRPTGSTGAAYFSSTSPAYRIASRMPSPPILPGAVCLRRSPTSSRNAEKIIPGRSKTSALRTGDGNPPGHSRTSRASQDKRELFPMPGGPEIITACPCSPVREMTAASRSRSSSLPQNSSGGEGAYETTSACCCTVSMILPVTIGPGILERLGAVLR